MRGTYLESGSGYTGNFIRNRKRAGIEKDFLSCIVTVRNFYFPQISTKIRQHDPSILTGFKLI